jgi:hypothetical protein
MMKETGSRASNYDAGLWIHLSKKKPYVTSHVDDLKIVCEDAMDKEWFGHIRKLPSCAYAHQKDVPKSHRLEERADLGWLIGFEGSKIYRVWITHMPQHQSKMAVEVNTLGSYGMQITLGFMNMASLPTELISNANADFSPRI